MINTAVKALALYWPNASVIKVISGTIDSTRLIPSKLTEAKNAATGRRSSAVHPYKVMVTGKEKAPMITNGSRASG